VEIRSKNSNIGENINKLSATVSGEEIEINFNHKYIIYCFQSIDSDTVSLSSRVLAKLSIADTSVMLNSYAKKADLIDTTSLSNRINSKESQMEPTKW
jgi:DNA polymerase III sliding clamp (beta) subunit (PCNA family)